MESVWGSNFKKWNVGWSVVVRKKVKMGYPWRTLVAGDEQPYRPRGKSS